MKHTPQRLFAALIVGAMTFAACGSDGNDAAPVETEVAVEVGTIVDVAVANGSFDTLVAAAIAADLAETLSSPGPFTVFAPTDDAFAALPAGLVAALLLPENKATLAKILTYHVVSGEVMAADVTNGDVATVEGQTVALSTADGVTVNGANVIIADVAASNGVIHAIDAVLLPPDVDAAALLAPAEAPVETDAPVEEEAAEVGTIVDVAVANGSFGTLVAAVTAADLAETLSGEGPFTVFAPTDDAFAALPEGLVAALLLPENKDTLVKILTYHVVSGEVFAADIADGDVATVEGQTVALSTADGVTVNGANVIIADVAASNGVIHAIDAVLLPPDVDAAALLAPAEAPVETDAPVEEEAAEVGTIVDVAVANGSFGTLVAAVTAADLAETLSGEGPFTVFAPTDDAFAALPEGLVAALLLPENKDTLVKILTYHVVSGEVFAADIADGDVATVEGQTVALSTADGVTVNGANVIIADVAASNGVIHAIDAVLLPSDVDPAALLS